MAIDNGYQACIMAPTEILATQHYESISQWLAPLGLRTELLTGSRRRSERKPILEGLETGEVNLLIGTHALLEEEVVFENLGMVIIDEQHRFGVAQRAKLWKKNTIPPHVLVMTATPIPRTLAMTVYGDLDVSASMSYPRDESQYKPCYSTTTVGQASTHHCDASYNKVGKFISYILSSKRVRRAT